MTSTWDAPKVLDRSPHRDSVVVARTTSGRFDGGWRGQVQCSRWLEKVGT
jgi:hypothetical protein